MFVGLDSFEAAFWVCATVGTTLFVLKSLLMIVGGLDGHVDTDAGDVGHEGADGSDVAFKLLSINSITGFFMMFGWVGLAAYKQMSMNGLISLLLGAFAGLVMMLLTARLFQSARLFTSSGSRFVITNAIGQIGSVYEEIQAGGSGKIQITVDHVTREIDAVSADGSAIASFKTIEVIEVVNPTTVSVRLKN